MKTKHIVLAGDSIFDNDGYVPGEAGVIEQLRKSIHPDWSASKIAVDGDCIRHVADQIKNLPSNTTDLIVSVGGNDARHHTHLFNQVTSAQSLNDLLAQPLAGFRLSYREMLKAIQQSNLQLQVCTIYTEIPFHEPLWRQLAPMAISLFNAVITDEARVCNIPVLRLHEVCILESDFSEISPIEPSSLGGQKIVDHILKGFI
ncbi:MAG TPA: SGNH/GDSL hydrolase family protein [Rhodobacteraceae bacterium]|nr:SGNH/GDSL hydrolase family protein [Paracoccaceae bacterium]